MRNLTNEIKSAIKSAINQEISLIKQIVEFLKIDLSERDSLQTCLKDIQEELKKNSQIDRLIYKNDNDFEDSEIEEYILFEASEQLEELRNQELAQLNEKKAIEKSNRETLQFEQIILNYSNAINYEIKSEIEKQNIEQAYYKTSGLIKFKSLIRSALKSNAIINQILFDFKRFENDLNSYIENTLKAQFDEYIQELEFNTQQAIEQEARKLERASDFRDFVENYDLEDIEEAISILNFNAKKLQERAI